MKNWQAEASGAPEAPPLAVWALVAAALAVLLIAPLPAYFDSRAAYEQALTDLNRARVDRFFTAREAAPARPLVAAVGTSLLFRASFQDSDMESLSAHPGEPAFRFLRIAAARAQFHQYRNAVEALIARRPDLLLLQIDLCYMDNLPQAYPKFLAGQCAAFWSRLISVVTRHPSRRPMFTGNRVKDIFGEPQRNGFRANRPEAVNEYRLTLERHAANIRTNQAEFSALLEHAAANGVKVAVLVIPRAPVSEQLKTGIFRAAEDALLREFKNRYGAAVISCPLQFGQDEYFDFGHLNDAGRARFAPWLAASIMAMLDQGEKRGE